MYNALESQGASVHAVDGDFESLDYCYADNPSMVHRASFAERKLWCAVIEQAFVDIGAISPARPVHTPPGASAERDEAVRWLLRENADFNRACLLAGVSPGVIRRAAKIYYDTRLSTERKSLPA